MSKNKTSFFSLIMLIGLAIASCQSNLPQSSNTPYVGPVSELNTGGPNTALWMLAKDSVLPLGSSSVAIQAIYLNGQETILFFTLSGMGLDEFTPGIPLQIADQRGYTSKLLKVVPFGMVGELSAGMMVFEPRRPGGQKLTLQWPAKAGSLPAEKLIATFTGQTYQDFADSTYFASQDPPVEQNGYRITLQWAIESGDPKGEAPAEIVPPGTLASGGQQTPVPAVPRTPTPVARSPLAELPPGVSILQNCALIFEDAADHQIEIINVQVLSNANAIVQSSEGVSVPEPIFINTILPTPTTPPANPYP